jgi:hypothetical protein
LLQNSIDVHFAPKKTLYSYTRALKENIFMSISGIGQGGNFFSNKLDPDAYAKQYAAMNGISVEQAREELKTKHGDPQQAQMHTAPQFGGFNNAVNQNKNDFDEKLKSLGIPAQLVDNKDKAGIEAYAKENGIKLPPPPDGARLNLML